VREVHSLSSYFPLSLFLSACAFTSGGEEEKKEAFNLARTCFQTLLESKDMDPDVSSFTNFFLVISRHLKPGPIRDQFAEAIFHEGCRRGKIGKQVLDNFRRVSVLCCFLFILMYNNFTHCFPYRLRPQLLVEFYPNIECCQPNGKTRSNMMAINHYELPKIDKKYTTIKFSI